MFCMHNIDRSVKYVEFPFIRQVITQYRIFQRNDLLLLRDIKIEFTSVPKVTLEFRFPGQILYQQFC